jgi:hypothetical protein
VGETKVVVLWVGKLWHHHLLLCSLLLHTLEVRLLLKLFSLSVKCLLL